MKPADTITIRCEPDYYGASLLIARELGMTNAPVSTASWVHGCDLLPIPREVFSPHFNIPTQTHLVANQAAAEWWRTRGMPRTIAAGCPFIYTTPSGLSRITDSVLAMPAHGLKGVIADEEHTREWLAQVRHLQKSFAQVTVCLHSHDVPTFAPYLDSLGIKWFPGASHDTNSLPYMRELFDRFEYVVTDTLGSHVAYAAWAGCKVCFLEPLHKRTWDQVRDLPHQKNHPEMEKNMVFHQRESLLERVPFLFVHNIRDAVCPQDWAADLLGVASKRTPSEMARLLGWKWTADDTAFSSVSYEEAALLLGSRDSDPEIQHHLAMLDLCHNKTKELKGEVSQVRKENKQLKKQLEGKQAFEGSFAGSMGRRIYSLEKRLRGLLGK